MSEPIDLKLAKLDPAAVFQRPEDVLTADLAADEKINILKQWRYDALELEVAAEENMLSSGNERNLLQRIFQCLHELGVDLSLEEAPPTKQGGA